MSPLRATATQPIRRIWSEFVPYQKLASTPVVELLRAHNVQLLVAITPTDLSALPALVRSYRDAGVELGLWPMVNDSDGRWGSTYNAQVYSDFLLRVLDTYEGACAGVPTTLAMDLEPPIETVRGALRGRPAALRRLLRSASWVEGRAVLASSLDEVHARGHISLAAVSPLLLADGRGAHAWQWLLGTPINSLPFDAISFMTYTSLLEGYSHSLVGRRVASALLSEIAQTAQCLWGKRASLSLGTVGGGALGDERPYRDLSELVSDVAVARAAGIEDLALFDLSGILCKSDPSSWIAAFASTSVAAKAPSRDLRARVLRRAIEQSGAAIGLYRRARERFAERFSEY